MVRPQPGGVEDEVGRYYSERCTFDNHIGVVI